MSDISNQLREIAARIDTQAAPPLAFADGVSVDMQNGCVQFEAIEAFRNNLNRTKLADRILDESLRHWYLLEITGREYTPAQKQIMFDETAEAFNAGSIFASNSNKNFCRLSPFEIDGVTVPDSFAVTAGNTKGATLEIKFRAYIPSFLTYRQNAVYTAVRNQAMLLRGDSVPATHDEELQARIIASGESIDSLASGESFD